MLIVSLLALGGGVGTVAQTFNVSAKEDKRVKDIREVTIAFQKMLVEVQPKQKVVFKTNCNTCRSAWLKDINKAKTDLEDKYHK